MREGRHAKRTVGADCHQEMAFSYVLGGGKGSFLSRGITDRREGNCFVVVLREDLNKWEAPLQDGLKLFQLKLVQVERVGTHFRPYLRVVELTRSGD